MIETLERDCFFHSIIECQDKLQIDKLVMVSHFVSGNDEFLLEINEKLPVAVVIPKPNSIDPRIMEKVSNHIPISTYSRDQIKTQSTQFIDELKKSIGDGTFAILDIGGYFAPILYKMKAVFGSQLVGVVEDTENGHQKYEALLAVHGSFPCPVISVARSALKESEDFLIGHSVVFSSEALLREQGEVLNGKQAVVFGYGKIGRSIALNLRARDVRVSVFDIDSNRQVLAIAHGFDTQDKDHLLSHADLVFGATGNRSLTNRDLAHIKQNAYVFTATSSDDEMEDVALLARFAVPFDHSYITKIERNGKSFFLCNNGNAVNFIHGGVVGPFIKLVQAEMLFALSQLTNSPTNHISQLHDESKSFISNAWIQHFV